MNELKQEVPRRWRQFSKEFKLDAFRLMFEEVLHSDACHVCDRTEDRTSGNHTHFSRTLHGFTLVELLVVITIIGVLAALITVAAVGALKRARESAIKAEINQIDAAFEQYKNKSTAYPPNCQIDGVPPSARPIDELAVYQNLKRHMKQVFVRHREDDDLLAAIIEGHLNNPTDYPRVLMGGMTAGEAIVFWLGGFSSDPKYPISGEGGPAYEIPAFDDPDNRKLDPIESRRWVFPFDVARLQPRDDDSYFDAASNRFIEYRDPHGVIRRINFWQYMPRRSEQPYLYFDTSRHSAVVRDSGGNLVSTFDPPAATERSGLGPLNDVYAFKKLSQSASSLTPIGFAHPGKFQILHAGLDDEWGPDAFKRMSAIGLQEDGHDPNNVDDYLMLPGGPFVGEVADTIVNFANETRIEDAQP